MKRQEPGRRLVNAFKMTGCVDCGWRPVNAEELRFMEVDHRDPKTKTRWPGQSHGHSITNIAGLENVFQELWNCDPVCVNCHKLRTRTRRVPDQLMLSEEMREWMAEPILPLNGAVQPTLEEP